MTEKVQTGCKVVIISEEEPFRFAFRDALVGTAHLDPITFALTGPLSEVIEAKPDVVVCDPSIEGTFSVDYLRDLRRALPTVRLVVVTDRCDEEEITAAVANGAQSVLLRTERLEMLGRAIETVCMGGVVFSLPVAEVVAARVMEAEAVPSLPGAVSRGLSAREIQVVQLIGRGYADAEIALELSISPRTVQHYVANAMNKLGARSRSEVVARVIGGAPPLARVR